MRHRWAVFLSGLGSNAQTVFEEISQGDVRVCVTSRLSAGGARRAGRIGIPVLKLEKNNWNDLDQELRQKGVTAIFLLGFMKILPEDFCLRWKGRIWNLHPSLLPDFKGADALKRSFEAGGAMGLTIHHVTSELDGGEPVVKKIVCRNAEDSFETFQEAELSFSIFEQMTVRNFFRNQQYQRMDSWT